MALHKLLVDDFYDDTYSLFAIHCTIEDYRVAYLLNQYLQINLKRNSQDLDINNATLSYSLYEWEDKNQQMTWNLVSNVCRKEENSETGTGSLSPFGSRDIRSKRTIPPAKLITPLTCELYPLFPASPSIPPRLLASDWTLIGLVGRSLTKDDKKVKAKAKAKEKKTK